MLTKKCHHSSEVEQLIRNQLVVGSIPAGGLFKKL